jgi:hypothetical protein
MTESSKSKLWWFAGLFLRLLLVSFLEFILFLLLGQVSYDLGFSSRISVCLIAICLIAGYTWAIHYEFPFFPSCTHRQRLLISITIALFPAFVAYYCLVFGLVLLFWG